MCVLRNAFSANVFYVSLNTAAKESTLHADVAENVKKDGESRVVHCF